MTSCTNHVAYQLPNTHSRVGYLLDGIEYDNAGLLLAIANVENDTGPGGRRDDVEACASHILPKDPVAKTKSSTTKRTSAVTGSKTVTSANTSKKKGKSGIRHSGVHLCYHKPEQYNALTVPQKKTESKLELDSHANMPVVEKYAHILSFTGQTSDVNAYNLQYEPMQIPMVDAAV